jgi:hypothetical protein
MEHAVDVKGGWSQIGVFFLVTRLAALFQSVKNGTKAGEPGFGNG